MVFVSLQWFLVRLNQRNRLRKYDFWDLLLQGMHLKQEFVAEDDLDASLAVVKEALEGVKKYVGELKILGSFKKVS